MKAMMNMEVTKRLSAILLVGLVILPVVACQKKDNNKTTIRSGRAARGTPDVRNNPNFQGLPNQYLPQWGDRVQSGTTQVRNNGYWGLIYRGQYWSNEEFNNLVHEFVSATMDPQMLGYVSGEAQDSTGVRFWGFVESANGSAINPLGATNAQIRAQTAELRIVIWDEYAGQLDSQGQVVPEYPVHIRGNASGWVQNGQAQIRFSDSVGVIELSGYYDAQIFQGIVRFENSGRSANYLGQFHIETCSFFRCQ